MGDLTCQCNISGVGDCPQPITQEDLLCDGCRSVHRQWTPEELIVRAADRQNQVEGGIAAVKYWQSTLT